MSLVDTHAHLDQEEFDADREAVIARADGGGRRDDRRGRRDGARRARRSSHLAAEHPSVFAAVGIQPNYTAQAEARRLGPHRRAGRRAATSWPWARRGWIAIGTMSPFDVQQDYFDRHLRLSQERRPAVHRPHARERRRRAGHAARGAAPRAAARA